MVDFKAIVNFSKNENYSRILSIETDDISNISSIQGLKEFEDNQTRPLIYNYSKFFDGGSFQSVYNGIISSNASDENGDINFLIKVVGIDLLAITIKFDNNYPQYATIIEVDGVEYTNNKHNFSVVLDSLRSEINIKIKKMNMPNVPIIIDSINLNVEKVFTKKQLSNVVFGRQTSSTDFPNLTFVGQYGSFDIIDIDEELVTLYKKGFLNENNVVTFNFNGNKIGTFRCKKWKTNENAKKISVELVDVVGDRLDKTYIDKLEWDNRSADELFNIILEKSGIKNYKIDDELFTYIRSISLYDNYTKEKMTIKEFINDFCELTLTTMFINNNGELEVVNCV